MQLKNSTLIKKTALELQMEMAGVPFFGAEGVELRKQIDTTGNLVCIGCLCGSGSIEIYQRLDCRRDIFIRSKFWFLWNWLIKPRIRDNQYRVLRIVPSPEFCDQLFVELARKMFDDKP